MTTILLRERREVTAARVKAHFGSMVRGRVTVPKPRTCAALQLRDAGALGAAVEKRLRAGPTSARTRRRAVRWRRRARDNGLVGVARGPELAWAD